MSTMVRWSFTEGTDISKCFRRASSWQWHEGILIFLDNNAGCAKKKNVPKIHFRIAKVKRKF